MNIGPICAAIVERMKMKSCILTPIAIFSFCVSAHAGQVSECSWQHPGANRFVGDKYRAVDSFTIPIEHRRIIKYKMKQREELGSEFPVQRVMFHKYKIVSDDGTSFNPTMTPMWFGWDTLCWHPSREGWKYGDVQPADLFCSDVYCVAVPDICGNVTQLFPGIKQFGSVEVERHAVRSVPEPGAMLLAAVGIAAVAFARRRKSIAANGE